MVAGQAKRVRTFSASVGGYRNVVMQDLEMRTLCGRVGTTFSARVEATPAILAYTFERQQR